MVKVFNIILKVIIILIIFQITFIPTSNASFWGDILDSGKEFIDDGSAASSSESDGTGINQVQLDSTIDKIYNALLALGVVISVIVGAALGIKFIVGSVEEQAKIKETLLPYVIGCIVVFGAFGIWRIAITLGQKIVPVTEPTTTTTSPTRPYIEKKGTWHWCLDCDRELTESEKRDQHCSNGRGHDLTVRTIRYFCSRCGDEWDEGERRQRECDVCGRF
ncbi:MAG: TrbC/VirB2 family protein [Clostridia bacterium]|nr:TrbC/VirB2 family protein [Clostridia bacterium]